MRYLESPPPADEDVDALKAEFGNRAAIPDFVEDVLRALPKTSHPMAMFSAAIVAAEEAVKNAFAEQAPPDLYPHLVQQHGRSIGGHHRLAGD